MSLVSLILFLLASAGATKIVTHGRIFDAIRPNATFFHCPMCIGFWMGVAFFYAFVSLGYVNVTHVTVVDRLNVALASFVYACAASLSSYILCTIIDDNGIRISKG